MRAGDAVGKPGRVTTSAADPSALDGQRLVVLANFTTSEQTLSLPPEMQGAGIAVLENDKPSVLAAQIVLAPYAAIAVLMG